MFTPKIYFNLNLFKVYLKSVDKSFSLKLFPCFWIFYKFFSNQSVICMKRCQLLPRKTNFLHEIEANTWFSVNLEKAICYKVCRVSAGVTTMLNFFTTSNGFRSTLPVVSNLTAMNVWDGVCMCFIYASLLEFVCVNYVGRKRPLHNVVYRPGENPVTQVLC